MDFVQYIDTRILIAINERHTQGLDSLMWWVSGTYNWIPLYALLIFSTVKKLGKQSIPLLLLIIVLILVSDQVASGILKNTVQRLRPSHDPRISHLLHYVKDYHGGLYGFVSSHAMNFFSLSFYFLFTTGKQIRWTPFILFPIAVIVAYSRVYLGVHYPSDVLVPIFLSCPIAYVVSRLNTLITLKYFDTQKFESSHS